MNDKDTIIICEFDEKDHWASKENWAEQEALVAESCCTGIPDPQEQDYEDY